MSKATVEQALTGLLPTINGPLPDELIEFAVSLLTRSRSVTYGLKPDEEIARPYACAQLACERLKKRLNLPTISSRPPCRPRAYKKLYNYLESALPESTKPREPETPRKASRKALASTQATPKTPLSAKRTPRNTRNTQDAGSVPPEWTMATIRTLVRALSNPSAAPHVYTGVECVLPLLARMSAAAPETPSKRPRRTAVASQPSTNELSDTRILSLIAVLVFYVLSRMTDEEITPEQYIDWSEKATSILLETEAAKGATEEEILEEFEQLMPMAQEEGWLQMEWFLNVMPLDASDDMEGVEVAVGTGAALKKTFKDGGSDYIGLATMMQDANDYSGEQQRRDYKRWKTDIMARVSEIEAS
ncbi:origin recognition complex, subunit 6 [Massariosphaeria phaeospora]|uniref:Origin recognition complex, subunit 6 n=1 Tax=Massariosphaeria phaeospora TaxID=100035 RepID=A0A7C8M648_9PLEO|nr:origin recognition complex, subunit 6 [Massariosphaeria phaeospora]